MTPYPTTRIWCFDSCPSSVVTLQWPSDGYRGKTLWTGCWKGPSWMGGTSLVELGDIWRQFALGRGGPDGKSTRPAQRIPQRIHKQNTAGTTARFESRTSLLRNYFTDILTFLARWDPVSLRNSFPSRPHPNALQERLCISSQLLSSRLRNGRLQESKGRTLRVPGSSGLGDPDDFSSPLRRLCSLLTRCVDGHCLAASLAVGITLTIPTCTSTQQLLLGAARC